MSREELVGTIVRLFALAIVVYVISRAPVLAILFTQAADLRSLVVGGGVFIILLGLGMLFWFCPLAIARFLLPKRSGQPVAAHLSAEELLAVGLVLVGMYLGYQAISDAVTWVMLALLHHGDTWRLRPEELAGIGATAVEAMLAILLIFGARGLATLVWKLRTPGTAGANRVSAEPEG